jgi:misacylated tRNA(Ala) deacylase
MGVLKFNEAFYPVNKVRKLSDEVFHYLDASVALPDPGAVVQGTLDWERRYKLMRTHTALHILCGVVFRDYGAQVTGGDMDPLDGRMDFEFETMQKELVQAIEAAVNKEVQADRPVRVAILPREEAFQIPDLIRTKINLLPEGIQSVRQMAAPMSAIPLKLALSISWITRAKARSINASIFDWIEHGSQEANCDLRGRYSWDQPGLLPLQ